MIKINNKRKIRKIMELAVLAVLLLISQLVFLCSENFHYVNYSPDVLLLDKMYPADLDLDWYVIDRESTLYRNLGITDEDVKEMYVKGYRSSPYVEYIDTSSFISTVDFVEAPYKLHIVRCEMADVDDMKKGLNVTIDSYTDSNGVTHNADRTILSYQEEYKRGDPDLIRECYRVFAAGRFGTCKIPLIKYLSYMPISEPDPYIGRRYFYWSDYRWRAEVVLGAFSLFAILAVVEKENKNRSVKFFVVFTIFCCVWFSIFIFL